MLTQTANERSPINGGAACGLISAVGGMFVNTIANVNMLGLRRQDIGHQREGRIRNESLDLEMKAILYVGIRINV